MTTKTISFMRDLEQQFKSAANLHDRSQYKIFYGQVLPAQILTLGMNPGGSPKDTSEDGQLRFGKITSTASDAYFENGENDVLDCEWPENNGLRKLLVPLLGGDRERIRTDVVKCNMAFKRSSKVSKIRYRQEVSQSAPFLAKIINIVQPRLVLLTGPSLSLFIEHFASESQILYPPERDSKVKQVVFAASRAKLLISGKSAIVIQVAHASQFSWTYERYNVAERIRALSEA